MEEHPQARFIIETLAQNGFVAYYAGGWVRDFLLKHPSDDIDIATNAPPETIQALFPKTVPIGIAFGIILVVIEGHEYEVATFRSDLDYQDGRRPSRIEFTTAIEDAKRRDFTINGMFYDPLRSQILDYVGGQEDLKRRTIRAIGDPHQRIREDRLRMIRAIRLSCRFDFAIDPETQAAIRAHATELFPAVAIERIVQELEKGLSFGKLDTMLVSLHEFGLLSSIFPELKNTTIVQIQERLAVLKHFPKQAPLIAWLLELFTEPHPNLAQQLKLPTYQHRFAQILTHAKNWIDKPDISLYEWAHFYAHPFASLVLQILAAHHLKSDFTSIHHQRQMLLARQIERIQTKNPVIQAADLTAAGILPGTEMGRLLKQAEQIAINEQLENKNTILRRLFTQ